MHERGEDTPVISTLNNQKKAPLIMNKDRDTKG